MAFNITTVKQTNLWGKQSSTAADIGLEPQRNDLFMIDFTNAAKNVAVVSKVAIAPILPQYVRSCTIPELRTKADPIRRDSLPYNMPSWDDPLDAIKIVFLMETSTQTTSNVVAFLDAWLAISRAGRGSRANGYYKQLGWLTLNANYTIDFRYDVSLYLLRGASLSNNFAQSNVTSTATVTPSGASITAAGNRLNATIGARINPLGGASTNLVQHSTYIFKNMWLGAYKMSDLNYAENGLVTVDATFYADSCAVESFQFIEGLPPELGNSNR